MLRRAAILMPPWLWLLLLVAAPVAVLVAIALAAPGDGVPPVTPPFRWEDGWPVWQGGEALAVVAVDGALPAEGAWAKAHVDEDFQISQWGEDAEAAERRGRRWQDFEAAATLAAAVRAA